MSLDQWKQIFALSDLYGFVIAADECYSEIYFDETIKPLGALEAA
jgi:N-succinyldiaminopimelate aminotransferase